MLNTIEYIVVEKFAKTGYRGLLPLLRISVLPEFYDGQTGGKSGKSRFFSTVIPFWGYGKSGCNFPFTLRPDEGSVLSGIFGK